MDTPRHEATESKAHDGKATGHPKGATHAPPAELAERGSSAIAEHLAELTAKLRRNPYRMIAAACIVGVGGGVLLSSRIMRAVLVSAASYLAADLALAFLRRAPAPPDAAKAGVDGGLVRRAK